MEIVPPLKRIGIGARALAIIVIAFLKREWEASKVFDRDVEERRRAAAHALATKPGGDDD